ncbi:MAG: cupin domain-containing protein [Deltaproteobacteria bacterium]|nr:MAG: cupin domain-containing protein [Deltaproteobacteria bacterium]
MTRGRRTVTTSAWQVFELAQLIEKKKSMAAPYFEFLRVPALSCGLYTLAAGSKDLQGPHEEDEVYYVISGRARLRVDDTEHAVGPGSLLYVRATSEHSFIEIEEDTTLLVFFASGGPSGS